MRISRRILLLLILPFTTCALALTLPAVSSSSGEEALATRGASSQPASRPGVAAQPYVDPSYGFSITPPKFSDGTGRGLVVRFDGPPQNGFAPTINVMVDTAHTNRKDYVEVSRRALLRAMDAKINAMTERDCHGFEAEVLDYEALMAVRKLRFLQLIVVTEDLVYIVTCTAPTDVYDQYKDAFQQAIDSFVPPSPVAK
jgi:hypothetical protein